MNGWCVTTTLNTVAGTGQTCRLIASNCSSLIHPLLCVNDRAVLIPSTINCSSR